jgi:tetratricopeptide (TPR) repeat protein
MTAAGERLRVGVVWSGSPTNPGGRFRAVPLPVFARLHDTGNVFFVNLQTGEAAALYGSSAFGNVGSDWSDHLADFGRTAALIAELDLVITIDTAVAHLAGALGAQVWILLSKACDWRWGAGGRTTPWYTSARLYRQQTQEVWDDVIEEVRRDLTLLAGQIRVPWSVREMPAVRAQMTQFDPMSFASWNNLGVALLEAGHAGEALAPFQQAVALEPDTARGHVNLAHAQLVEGQWNDGLENLEWRLHTEEGSAALRPYTQPRWAGQPLRGKTVFLYAEQGFGDAIQFIRYAWLLAQSGARVVVEVRRELKRLMQHAPGVSGVVVRGEEPPAFHYHSPLLSLPFAFRTTTATVPARTPYLIAGNEQLLEWKKRMKNAGGNTRIGICWSGNTRFAADAERSISAEMMCTALPQAGVAVYPLVKEGGTEDCPSTVDAGRWCDLTAELSDFADTAALLAYLDAVVTVDTAVAHLAGAIARPVFLLLPFSPDWRWLSAGDTTPWYPGMRLFRQTTPGSWDEPLRRVRIALTGFMASRAAQAAQGDAEDSGDRHG